MAASVLATLNVGINAQTELKASSPAPGKGTKHLIVTTSCLRSGAHCQARLQPSDAKEASEQFGYSDWLNTN
jgi:hypothetical protein